jgi:predicted amidohydrolase
VIVALASPRIASSLKDGLERVRRLTSEASGRGAEIVCFPEAYLPGLRGQDFDVLPFGPPEQDRTLRSVAQWAREYAVAVILGTERLTERGRQIASYVVDRRGEVLGYQTKNQLDPTEDRFYVPGETRRLFEVHGTKFGVAICHEGWRYPETVRFAARRGAQVVFHPHFTPPEPGAFRPTTFGDPANTFHEKAALCRAAENTCYFATVNYAIAGSGTTSAIARPDGTLLSYQPYGEEGLLVADLDLSEATGLLAGRLKTAS